MPDFHLRGIEEELAERIKTHARNLGCTLNEAMIDLLRTGTLLSGGLPIEHPHHEVQDIAELTGTLNQDESQALRQAIKAFERFR